MTRLRPTDLGGDAVSEYQIYANGLLMGQVSAQELREFRVTKLAHSTTYVLTVRAVSAVGTSRDSAPLMVSTMEPTNPDAPTSAHVTQVSGGFVTAIVAEPENTGGVGIAQIKIWVQKGNGVPEFVAQGLPNTPITVYGLDHSTSYGFYASAVNTRYLESSLSSRMIVKTGPMTIPSRCPAPQVLETTGGSVTLELIDPVDSGGSPLTGFSVYIKAPGDLV